MSKPKHVELAELAGWKCWCWRGLCVGVPPDAIPVEAPDSGAADEVPDWWDERLETHWRLWLVQRMRESGSWRKFVDRLFPNRISHIADVMTLTNERLADAALETLRAAKVNKR